MLHEMIISISKGQQITIPANIREELGLDVGSRMEIEEEEGKIILKPLGKDLRALFKKAKKSKPKHHLTAPQMDELNEKMFQ